MKRIFVVLLLPFRCRVSSHNASRCIDYLGRVKIRRLDAFGRALQSHGMAGNIMNEGFWNVLSSLRLSILNRDTFDLSVFLTAISAPATHPAPVFRQRERTELSLSPARRILMNIGAAYIDCVRFAVSRNHSCM